MNLQALSSLPRLLPILGALDGIYRQSIILVVFQLYVFHQSGLPRNAARIWELMGQVRSQLHPGMLLRPGPPPDHHSCCQHLTNPSTSVLPQEIKATFLSYYPVIFMLGGKVNVRDCRSTPFALAARETSEHKEFRLLPASSRSEPAI